MQENIVSLLRCPRCSHERLILNVFVKDRQGDVKKGTVVCRKCHSLYPIEEYALEFLPSHLPRAQKEQQKYFDWYAENQTQNYTNYAESTFWKTTDSLIFGEWKKQIVQKTRLLDVGSAQGRSAFLVADLPIDIVAFDISKEMIRQAVARYKKDRYRATMSFLIADATNFPFRPRSFDTVLLYGVLHHLVDPARACSEIARVLKRGGQYFGLENHVSPLRRIFDVLQSLNPIWYEKAGTKPLMTPEDFTSWFSKSDMILSTSIRTFVPPHLINILREYPARWLVTKSDTWANRLGLSLLGGLLVIEGKMSKKNKT